MKKTALILLALCLGACDQEMHVSGHVYDLATGRLATVVDASRPAR